MKKRVLTMLLALVMTFGFCVPVFAAEDAFEAESPAIQEEEAPAAPAEAEEEPLSEPEPADGGPEEAVDEPAAAVVTDGIIDSGQCGDNITWTLDSNRTLTFTGTGKMWNYVYGVDNYDYTSRSPWSRRESYRNKVKSVYIQDGITSIGAGAFYGCPLESIVIPESVTQIMPGAFYGCSFLKSITLPENVTYIGERCFYNSSLAEIAIPASVTTIEPGAFASDNKFKPMTVSVAPGNKNYMVKDGVLFTKNGAELLFCPMTKEETYEIPSTVKTVRDFAFYFTQLSGVVIPDSVTTIGNEAFYCGGLTSLELPDSLVSIGETAFYECNKLSDVVIPRSVLSIGAYAFYSRNPLTVTVLNPNCEFDWVALGTSKATVYGYTGSTAEKNAKRDYYTFVSLGTAPAMPKNGWQLEAGSWRYYINGKQIKSDWVTSEGKKYYMNEKGVMATGWQVIDDGWYYFDRDGVMTANKWLQNGSTWYFLDQDGRMKEGFDEIALGRTDDGWYYFNPKHDGSYGRMMTGWQCINDTWYYFNKAGTWPQGKMVTNNWLWDAGVWYFMGMDGKMYEGLTRIALGRSDDGLYYFSEKHDGSYGHVMSGWQTIDGDRYYFDPTHKGFFGRAYTDGTYQIGGQSYTFDSEGKLVG